MADFDTLQADANRLIGQEPPVLPEIRKLMVEMDEFFSSPDLPGAGSRTAQHPADPV